MLVDIRKNFHDKMRRNHIEEILRSKRCRLCGYSGGKENALSSKEIQQEDATNGIRPTEKIRLILQDAIEQKNLYKISFNIGIYHEAIKTWSHQEEKGFCFSVMRQFERLDKLGLYGSIKGLECVMNLFIVLNTVARRESFTTQEYKQFIEFIMSVFCNLEGTEDTDLVSQVINFYRDSDSSSHMPLDRFS